MNSAARHLLLVAVAMSGTVSPNCSGPNCSGQALTRLAYNQPDLVVDLGVGLWASPLPMDFDGDGDYDLVVVCHDKPSGGTFFFENTQGDVQRPIFRPGRRLSKGLANVQVSYVDGKPHVLTPAREYTRFLEVGLAASEPIDLKADLGLAGKLRANQWKYADYDADGRLDLIVGIGDWTDYGWDNAFDASGNWTRGPLHGYVYWVRNVGTADAPRYADPVRLTAGGQEIDVYGRPSPNLADFDRDGDLDLICGEFLDGFHWFENTGTSTAPQFAAGRRLMHQGTPIRMDLQMIAPVAFDWDKDGDQDLIVGDEDGRVAFVENTGALVDGMPQFLPPVYFQQQAEFVKFGALATPCGFDWDGDGDDDILCGNTAGYIACIENLGGDPPRWAEPRKLAAAGTTIRIQAGPNGSIQGPCEAKWGYTTLTVGDWDQDGLPDLVVNSIWGRVVWYRNIGTRTEPQLDAAQAMLVEWPADPPQPAWNWWSPAPRELVTQWRTTPVIVDFDGNGLRDLMMLDHEGYLALFSRYRDNGVLQLAPGQRIFVDELGALLRLNERTAGRSGRRKLAVVDWDQDGRLDLLVNSTSANWLRNVRTDGGKHVFIDQGTLDKIQLAGHTSSPTVVDFNRDQIPELLVGAEDGYLYYLPRHE